MFATRNHISEINQQNKIKLQVVSYMQNRDFDKEMRKAEGDYLGTDKGPGGGKKQDKRETWLSCIQTQYVCVQISQ